MNHNILSLVQEHTRRIYDLEHRNFVVKQVYARDLLNITRFDLFAKLFYIKYKDSNQELAERVYVEHIKAFNPDLKEPGREDKCGLKKFVTTFNALIDKFASSEFDDTVSVVPVDKNGIILDGAHRVAALAYYGKKVTIVQFDDVISKGIFNYNYFLTRGLSIEIADIIALEATNWCKNLYAACLWPKLSKSKDRKLVKQILKSKTELLYEKSILVSLENLTQFVAKIYGHQDWVGTKENNFKGARDKATNCYSLQKRFDILFFQSSLPLDDIIKMKEDIRNHFNYGKHAIHITDNDSETQMISQVILDKNLRGLWLKENSLISLNSIHEKLNEWGLLFKYNLLVNLKTKVYSLIHP